MAPKENFKKGNSMKGKVVILGGGFTGLRIAQLLAKNDYHVIIIEKQSFLGGMVTSFKKTGGTLLAVGITTDTVRAVFCHLYLP